MWIGAGNLSIVALVGEEGKGRIIAEGRPPGILGSLLPNWSLWWMKIFSQQG